MKRLLFIALFAFILFSAGAEPPQAPELTTPVKEGKGFYYRISFDSETGVCLDVSKEKEFNKTVGRIVYVTCARLNAQVILINDQIVTDLADAIIVMAAINPKDVTVEKPDWCERLLIVYNIE